MNRKMTILTTVAGVVVVGVVVAVIDPFGGSGASGSSFDNGYPTGITTIARETITSQTDVSATLGYSGSYNVNIPNGTTSGSVAQAQAAAQSAEQRVADDEASLEQALKMEDTQGAATDLAANSTLTSDEQGLTKAEEQLTIDEETGCPAASSSNTTTPIGGSSNPGGNDDSSSNPGGSSSPGGSSNPGGTTGTTGNKSATDPSSVTTTEPRVGSPSASASATTQTTLSGKVDPGGLSTTYYFDYGVTLGFGERTPAASAGSGGGYVPVSANVSGLSEGTSYLFELVATNSKGTTTTSPQSFSTATSSCAEQRQTVSTDETAVTEAQDSLNADEASAGTSVTSATQQLESDEAAAASADQSMSQTQSTETNSRTTYTYIPAAGSLLTRGSTAYSLDGVRVPLFYGEVTPWRALYAGVSDGSDVGELNANLIALGYEKGAKWSDHFSAATTSAVEAWQRAMSAPASGVVSLGDLVVEPGSLLVGTVNAALGQATQPGQTVFSATSNSPVVTIALDPSEQSYVHVGDPVTVTLPDGSNTQGVISSVGKVAISSSSDASGNTPGGGGGSSPTITVLVALTHPSDAGGLDQASVNVAITYETAPSALVVPVDALLALAGGGYALEEVSASGAHSLVAANVGIFDDANGTVQVSGSGLAAGQRIVVPSL
jgi:hypothetical protein